MADNDKSPDHRLKTVRWPRADLARVSEAARVAAEREPGRRVTDSDIIRMGALQFADQILGKAA